MLFNIDILWTVKFDNLGKNFKIYDLINVDATGLGINRIIGISRFLFNFQ